MKNLKPILALILVVVLGSGLVYIVKNKDKISWPKEKKTTEVSLESSEESESVKESESESVSEPETETEPETEVNADPEESIKKYIPIEYSNEDQIVSNEDTEVLFSEIGDVNIEAEAAVLVDALSNKIIYAKNANVKRAPASTTKLLTALTVLQYLDMDDTITAGAELSYVASDASRAYVEPGDELTVRELMTGMLICSGNDAAYVLAAHAGEVIIKSEDENVDTVSINDAISAFVQKMNENAADIGCVNSNFVVPDGYDTKDQYTTALDLSRIAATARKNLEIRSICQIKTTRVSMHGYVYTWTNTNELLKEDSEYYCPFVDGMKTGTTGDAGKCFVSSASFRGNAIIGTVLDSPENGRWSDTKSLIEQGIEYLYPGSLEFIE